MRRTKRIALGLGIAAAALASSGVLAQTPTTTRPAQATAAGTGSTAPTPAAPAATPDAGLSPEERARRATPAAHVGDVVITVGELEDMLNEAPQPVRQSYADPARRRDFLENMIQTILLSQEAQRRGLDRQPEAAASIRRILAQRLEQSAIIEAITPETVTDAEVHAYYDQHIGDYQQPEFRRATVVFTDDRAAADQVTAALRAARGDMRRVQAIVRERSTDALTREHDGDLFYFRRDGVASGTPGGQTSVDHAVAIATFGLAREMDVADPVHAANGKWAVAASIRGFIVRERRSTRERELLEELRTRLHPEVHEELLDQLHLPTADLGNVPPFAPGAVPRRPPTPMGASPVPPPANPRVVPPGH